VRIYSPFGVGPFPLTVYFHGGGFVLGNLDSHDHVCRHLCLNAHSVVVAVDYRLAPEHKFPAAHDDAFAQYRWILGNTGAFSGDEAQIAVAGESAGGNLAMAVAMMARDAGIKVPVHIAAVYPIAGNDMTTESYVQNAHAKPLNKAMMQWFVPQVFASKDQTNDPRINLVGANLRNLPGATIILAEIDPLRSEGEMLAKRLKDAGSEVDCKIFDGVTHEFFGMGLVVGDALSAEKMAAHGLKKAFGTDTLL
jgi:acetyl esterase/lipase